MKGYQPRHEMTTEEITQAVMKVVGPTLRPLRQKRAPFVKPNQFFRRCHRCGTDFMATEGGATERGPWGDSMRWYCSVECLENSQ